MKKPTRTKSSKQELKPSIKRSNSQFSLEFIQELKDVLAGKTPQVVEDFEELVRDDVARLGFEQQDIHLGRKVWAFPGHFVVVKDPKVLRFYQRNPLLGKYRADWDRMVPSFITATHDAKKDPASRQLMVFNDADYYKVRQCFTHFQFVYTRRKEYDLYVYQRSADMVKFRDDMTFFAHIADAFTEQVGIRVTKIVVVYGHIHFEIKK